MNRTEIRGTLSSMDGITTRAMALILDFLFVDFRTGFVDHDHASTLVAVVKVNGDLTGDQVGGFPGVVLVLAIQSNRIFEPDTVSDVKMKMGIGSSLRSMPSSQACSRMRSVDIKPEAIAAQMFPPVAVSS